MCGIVGYVGDGKAAEFLLAGLSRLEYRGYDSSGIAVYDGETICEGWGPSRSAYRRAPDVGPAGRRWLRCRSLCLIFPLRVVEKGGRGYNSACENAVTR